MLSNHGKPLGRPSGTALHGRVRYLTPQELDAVLNEARKEGRKWSLVMHLTYYLALRVSECAAIRLEDFSDPPNYVTIQGLKNGLKRPYPLPPGLQKMLRQWLSKRAKLPGVEGNPWLFPHRDRTGDHITDESIQAAFYRILHRAGLKDHSVHDLRHTAAQDLCRTKQGQIQVASWLRHRDIQSSKRYIDHSVDLELDAHQVDEFEKRFK